MKWPFWHCLNFCSSLEIPSGGLERCFHGQIAKKSPGPKTGAVIRSLLTAHHTPDNARKLYAILSLHAAVIKAEAWVQPYGCFKTVLIPCMDSVGMARKIRGRDISRNCCDRYQCVALSPVRAISERRPRMGDLRSSPVRITRTQIACALC
jgi:hypothetical protein